MSNPTNKREVKVSVVLELLNEGKKRSEIREALGLNATEMKILFSHSLLKSRKARKVASNISVVDDVTETPVAADTVNVETEAVDLEENTAALDTEVEEGIPAPTEEMPETETAEELESPGTITDEQSVAEDTAEETSSNTTSTWDN